MNGGCPLQLAMNVGKIPTVGRFLVVDKFNGWQIAPQPLQKFVRRRHAELRLARAMLTRGRIEDDHSKPEVSGQKERTLREFKVRVLDVLVELVKFYVAMVLIARPIAVCNLDKEHQLAIAPTALQIPPVQFDFDVRHESLVKGEFGTRHACRPTEGSLLAFAEPAIEGDLFKCRIERTGRSRH